MALMSDIVNDVLEELRFGSGQDVQIHLQEGIIRNVSRLYRTLMKQMTFRDYFTSGEYTTDASTGQVTADISAVLTRFSNIIGVFLDQETAPLPVLPIMSNPKLHRRPGIVPSGNDKIFTIWPKEERPIVLVAKQFSEDNFAIDAEVPFYRDLLAVGASYMLAEKAGTNDRLTASLKQQFENLINIYRIDELHNLQINVRQGQYPTDWYVDET